MEAVESNKIFKKIIGFSLIGLFFWILTPNAGYLIYLTLVIAAVLALAWKSIGKPPSGRVFILGLFLMLFGWVVENAGGVIGLWNTYRSVFPVLYVPIEIMLLTLIGGMAWAMHLPERLTKRFILAESLVFGFFGSLGEWLLIKNGIMSYNTGWTSVHAFFGYFLTWLLLFAVWSRIKGKPKTEVKVHAEEPEPVTLAVPKPAVPKPARKAPPRKKPRKKKSRKKRI